jgi:hypothetical protein
MQVAARQAPGGHFESFDYKKCAFTARGRLIGCAAEADAGTFPRMTRYGAHPDDDSCDCRVQR